ncbi:phosphofurin acidic cluster sorting protein 2 isoform X2 [Thrips palmi]|uniref:Phosphofurin acidic cluster sorting protein 2 isoform X2 n=1 Tax=Thrips palmi TaxID=161013 RepID=A0A6P8ZYP3_THRPL|nr:phosphofurin acidic cluster sorting protein 2 isoform X2 [Thrips palmi]
MAERGVGGRQLPLALGALGQTHISHGQPHAQAGPKPVPMKLFATWEVDRTPPNCIPRLCSLTLSRLVVLKPLGPDLSSLSIAVKMQGLKRTLRSNELVLPPRGLLDTELQLHFSLQYPHLLKRGGNQLHVSLQRRKRYKNRTILGYKTLAEGVVNMSQVLQKQLDLELELCGDSKEPKSHHNVVARVSVLGLNSQPVDHEDTAKVNPHDVSDRVGDFSDEDEEFSSNEDGVEEAEGSDSEPMLEDNVGRRALQRQRQRQAARAGAIPTNARQRNLKQKFISLLKRFRVSEDLQGLDHDQEELAMSHKLSAGGMDATEFEDLMEELGELSGSDSGPEVDTLSMSSTPKPSLRPFFSSSRSLVHDTLNVPGTDKSGDRLSDESSKKADSDSHPENWTDHETSDPPPPTSSPPKQDGERERDRKSKLFMRDRNASALKTKKQLSVVSFGEHQTRSNNSNSNASGDITPSEPRKVLLEQLSKILPADDVPPDHLILVNVSEMGGASIANRLADWQHKVVGTAGMGDVRAAVSCILGKIQKFCNSSSRAPTPLRVLLIGGDSFLHSVLRCYVEQLSFKPPEWQSYLRFLSVPLGGSWLGRYLCSLDANYASAFGGDAWREVVERAERGELCKADWQEVVGRISRYLHNNFGALLHLPVAEAMLTYKSSDEESSQIFIPFMNEVRLGSQEPVLSASVDLEESASSVISGSPPSHPQLGPAGSPAGPNNYQMSVIPSDRKGERITPPSSPNINSIYMGPPRESPQPEPMELQLDYWLCRPADTPQGSAGKPTKPDSAKSTLKTAFRSLQVARAPPCGEFPPSFTPQQIQQQHQWLQQQHLFLNYCTKEKKQKIMRLGKKKEKERDSETGKNQSVDGVSRLICSPKIHNIPLRVSIDGTEWSGVKFFQLSAQWPTHIKHFPLTLLGSVSLPTDTSPL